MRGGMLLYVPAMELHDTGEEHGKKSRKEKDKTQKVLVRKISHKWQSCSTSRDTIVKYLSSQLWVPAASPEVSVTLQMNYPRALDGAAVELRTINSGRMRYSTA
jgi:hypothetical protein